MDFLLEEGAFRRLEGNILCLVPDAPALPRLPPPPPPAPPPPRLLFHLRSPSDGLTISSSVSAV